MTKGDLIESVATSGELTKAQATEAVNTVFGSIESCLKSGEKLTMPGFGTFSINRRAARDGRNPATGETIKIKAKNVVKFKTGKGLDEAVNNKKK